LIPEELPQFFHSDNIKGGENMTKGTPKRDGTGRGRGQPGKGCGGIKRKRAGRNR